MLTIVFMLQVVAQCGGTAERHGVRSLRCSKEGTDVSGHRLTVHPATFLQLV
jgi:hypothetical protein